MVEDRQAGEADVHEKDAGREGGAIAFMLQ